MLELLLNTLLAGLTLWNNHEAGKYRDRVLELRKKHREEINRPPEERNDALIDNIEWELRVLATAFSSSIGKQDAADKPGSTRV